MERHSEEERSRAEGALYGLAIGDALGMPTQLLPRAEVVRRYGDLIDRFFPGPPDHPIAAGLPAGRVTDDTEQAVLVGGLLVEGGGHVAPRVLADALRAWERDVAARGSLDLLGPSTRRSLAALEAGVPVDEAGREGTTNGAAMRIAPVGIVVAPSPGWADLVDRVEEVSRVTHNTGLAIAGAAAVAAAVSAGIAGTGIGAAAAGGSGAGWAGVGAAAVTATFGPAAEAARVAARRGHWVAGAEVAARIEWAVELVAGRSPADAIGPIVSLVGTSLLAQESVPAAFAVLATVPDDPWRAVRMAASLGGDTDTIAAMVGTVAGACHGVTAWPEAARRAVDAAAARGHGLGLEGLAADLLALRAASAGALH